ncbi:hypothetical protein EDB85DRAFT_1977291 [Lactarius pseudohatsudake]|nr:hypothetical protein EDB85DRAFT_1977291 [Lactarius pseudohatsudake]
MLSYDQYVAFFLFIPAGLTCAAPRAPVPLPAPMLSGRPYFCKHSPTLASSSPTRFPTKAEVFAQDIETSRIDSCPHNDNRALARPRFSISFIYVLIMDPGAHMHMCRFCGDAEFMSDVWQRHDAMPLPVTATSEACQRMSPHTLIFVQALEHSSTLLA